MKKIIAAILSISLLITTVVMPGMTVNAADYEASFTDTSSGSENDPIRVEALEELDFIISSGGIENYEQPEGVFPNDVKDKQQILDGDKNLQTAGENVDVVLENTEYVSGKYTYTLSNNEATITKVDTSISGSVTVPTTLGGYSVATIGPAAFSGCGNITSILIGDSVKTINENAFVGCMGITSITIGAGVNTISPTAFLGCISIAKITVSSSNKAYYSLNNCIIETETLTLVLGCKNSVIPSNGEIGTIGPYAFYACTGLGSVTIPNSVTKIGNSAFMVSSITGVDLGERLTTIEDYAFAGCEALEDVIVPDTINYVGTAAFAGCEEIYGYTYFDGFYLGNSTNKYLILYDMLDKTSTSYTLGAGVRCIYDEAMSECVNLKNFTIPSTVTTIGAFAFANCSSLTNLTIPDSVSSVGASAFLDCDKLVYNIYNDGKYLGNSSNKYVVFIAPTSKSISEFTFANGVKCLYSKAFSGCSNLKSISIPGSVSIISEGAFEGCTSLKSISLGGKVKGISGFAFKGCTQLEKIAFTSTVTDIGGYAFYDCPALKMVNYRAGEQAKNKILIAPGNDNLLNAAWSYIDGGEFYGTVTNPVKPIVIEYTCDTVVLYPFEGYEFSKDGVNWQTRNVFDNLEDETTYTFYQRIKTSSGTATASSIVVTTADFSWDTNKEFDYLRAVINRDYNYLDDGDPCIRIYEDFGGGVTGYYSLTDKGAYIRFGILSTTSGDTYIGSVTYMDLWKTSTTLDISHLLAFYVDGYLYDSAFGTGTIERYNHEQGDTYNFYKSGSYVIGAQDFCDSFNDDFTTLTLFFDPFLYLEYNSGLNTLGFISYDGMGAQACDPLTGYHAGYQEVRGNYDAGCVLKGNTGHIYCGGCDQILESGFEIESKGYHSYDNDCDETCNTCNEYRITEHTYSADCDDRCDNCFARRTPAVDHVFDNADDMFCNNCGASKHTPGDIDGVEGVTDADAEYLLMYTFFPEDYPVNQNCDFNGDSFVNDADAEHLLMYTFFPEDYPLH